MSHPSVTSPLPPVVLSAVNRALNWLARTSTGRHDLGGMGAYADWTLADAYRAGYAVGWRCTEVAFELVPGDRATRGGSYVAGTIEGFRDRQAGAALESGASPRPPIEEWTREECEQFTRECQAAVRGPGRSEPGSARR